MKFLMEHTEIFSVRIQEAFSCILAATAILFQGFQPSRNYMKIVGKCDQRASIWSFIRYLHLERNRVTSFFVDMCMESGDPIN